MFKKQVMFVAAILIVASMLFAACQPATPAVPAEPVAPAEPGAPATEVPAAPAEAPTAEPTPFVVPLGEPVVRTPGKGAWLDQVVFSVVDSGSALTQIAAGAIDLYADGLSSADLPAIKESGVKYSTANGLYYDLLFNPAVFADGRLNPFSNRKIREAMNWLVDRNYINQEVYNGGALAKWFAIQTQGPDYVDLIDTARSLETKYAYNFDKAKEVITAEMTAMGATLGADGKWADAAGQPVKLTFIIRNDSDKTRLPIGDYTASQLELVGFTVDRQYKKGSEASPIWIGSVPEEGQWSLYTAAWSSTIIDRDEANMFQEMYLPSSLQGIPAWFSNVPDPEFRKLGDDLFASKYTDLAQRKEMMQRAMELSLQDSLQVWLIDGKGFIPYTQNAVVTADLAAGVQGAQIWPYTVRFAGQEGGTFRWATQDMFGQAWNPIAGSNWAFDAGAYRGTMSGDVMYDPFTGLVWPLRIEKADVTVQEGKAIGKTLDWVTLNFAPEIVVPGDVWADWDATTQTFVTFAQKLELDKIAAAKALEAAKLAETEAPAKMINAAKAALDLPATATEEEKAAARTAFDEAVAVFEGAPAAVKAAETALFILDKDAVQAAFDTAKKAETDAIDAVAIAQTALDTAKAAEVTAQGAVDTAKAALDGLAATATEEEKAAAQKTYDDAVVAQSTAVDNTKSAQASYDDAAKAQTDASNATILAKDPLDKAKARLQGIHKTTVTYPADLYQTVKWHDGSAFSIGDVVMGMIMTFDRAKEGSAIYDPQAVPQFETFMSAFKGMKIVSTDPLVVDYYSDTILTDAELLVPVIWPTFSFGEGAWHELAVGNQAEAAGELAYSIDKAEPAGIEETSFIGGPSLEILAKYVDQDAADSYVPYAPTMGTYVTAEEAAARYANYKAFYEKHKHFWLGTGPYLVDRVYMTEKALVLRYFPEYPDASDRWSNYGEPKVADVSVEGPEAVTIGQEVKFDVFVTFKGEPYLNADVKYVKAILYNALGETVLVAEATAAEEGHYVFTLTAEESAKLAAGSNKLEIAVVPSVVNQPTFSALEFVTQ